MKDKDYIYIERLKIIYRNAWSSWKGKAGGFAKSENPLVKLANKQKHRYFNKYADLSGISEEQRAILIKNKFI